VAGCPEVGGCNDGVRLCLENLHQVSEGLKRRCGWYCKNLGCDPGGGHRREGSESIGSLSGVFCGEDPIVEAEDRVTVGPRIDNPAAPGGAPGAGDVDHDQWVRKETVVIDSLLNDANKGVTASSCGERDHHLDRTIREFRFDAPVPAGKEQGKSKQ